MHEELAAAAADAAREGARVLLEYFRGRSPNGQFYRDKVEYLGLGVHFHF